MVIVFQPVNHRPFGVFYMKTVKKVAIDRWPILNVGLPRKVFWRFNGTNNVNAEC